MELVKIIFESFGGRELERIFRNYFFLSLLFKQLVFSIFYIPADANFLDPVPAENEQTSEHIVAAKSSKAELNGIQIFQLMWTLAQIETGSITEKKEL